MWDEGRTKYCEGQDTVMPASGESCISWVASTCYLLRAVPWGSMGLHGAPAALLVPTGHPLVLSATTLFPAVHCATVGKQKLGPRVPC